MTHKQFKLKIDQEDITVEIVEHDEYDCIIFKNETIERMYYLFKTKNWYQGTFIDKDGCDYIIGGNGVLSKLSDEDMLKYHDEIKPVLYKMLSENEIKYEKKSILSKILNYFK